jgi:hypothetical protein
MLKSNDLLGSDGKKPGFSLEMLDKSSKLWYHIDVSKSIYARASALFLPRRIDALEYIYTFKETTDE